MQKLDFIEDILNEILDDDPMASLVPVDGQALEYSENSALVMTSHTMIENVDFDDADKPGHLASKLIRVCVAKLAAKGAVARNCTLVVNVTDENGSAWIQGFAKGLAEDLNEFGLALSHCETKQGEGACVVSITAVGELQGEPMSAANAIPGDLVCLSGQVGLAALGALVQKGRDLEIEAFQAERFQSAYNRPEPNWALGSFLSDQAKAKSTINISRGLVPDLQRLARLSDVAVNVDFSAIDFADNSLPVGPQLFESSDHQLIMCLPPSSVELVKKWFPQVIIIGHVLAGDGVRFVDGNGSPVDLDKLQSDTF